MPDALAQEMPHATQRVSLRAKYDDHVDSNVDVLRLLRPVSLGFIGSN